jgi:Domain of unknown function (DUF4396)
VRAGWNKPTSKRDQGREEGRADESKTIVIRQKEMSLVVRWGLVLAVVGFLASNAVACPLWISILPVSPTTGCCPQQSSESKHCPTTVCQVEAPYLVSQATAYAVLSGSEFPAVTPKSSLIGSGCTLGDILAEWGVFFTGFTLLGSLLWGSYLADFLLAYLLGIVFQYFSIAPMRNISGWPALKAALQADTISLIAFEVGLFAFMFWRHHHFEPHLLPSDPRYWFLMQVGMIIGFFTSFPAIWWLIRQGWKEAM